MNPAWLGPLTPGGETWSGPQNIRLELACDQCDFSVSADPTRMRQMIMNLVINARDAMPTGGPFHIGLHHISVLPDSMPFCARDVGR
jgi:hypothetical protein